MKWLAGWVIIFVLSWGLGAIVCGITAWRKNVSATKIAAAIFFGLPVVFLAADLIKQKMIVHNYHEAVEEVKALCAKDGGDKIYKTVDNVQGVFQMRLRQPESYRDEKGRYHRWISDQYGMEDPYGWAYSDRDDMTGAVGGSVGYPQQPMSKQSYWFIEQQEAYGRPEGSGYRRSYLAPMNNPKDWQIRESNGNPLYEVKQNNVSKLKSKYGYLTEDLTTKEMREKWIGAGRIKVVDLQTNEVLAERKGYFRASGDTLPINGIRWHGTFGCPDKQPSIMHFLHSVLKPVQDFPTNEQLESIAKE